MGIKKCKVYFNHYYNTFYAGQTVNGKVEITFDSPKIVSRIWIQFKGEANTRWSIYAEQEIVLTGSEEYCNIMCYLLGGSNSTKTDVLIGQQVYHFSWVLPLTLPSSFEGEFGHVRYTVKVVLDRPGKLNQKVKIPMTVLSPVDLNMISGLREPQRLTLEKFFCCLCCTSGPLTCVVSIPFRGFVPGQTIPFIVEVDNTSNVDVLHGIFTVQKKLTYRSQTPVKQSRVEKTKLKSNRVGRVAAHKSMTWKTRIIIPPIPFFNLINCSLIDLDYELRIEALVDGCHKVLTGKIPLTIGNIPLTGLAEIPAGSSTELPQNNQSGSSGWFLESSGN